MKNLPVTTKTSKEIATDFATVFKQFKPRPADAGPTPEERLAPYRRQILKLRRWGVPWKKIAAGMRDPRIGETVSDKLLRTLFGAAEASAGAPTPATSGAPAPASPPTPARPARHRLVLDPLTGQPVDLDRSA